MYVPTALSFNSVRLLQESPQAAAQVGSEGMTDMTVDDKDGTDGQNALRMTAPEACKPCIPAC